MFINAEALHALLQSENPPVIFDCRFSLAVFSEGNTQFNAGHIPGAFHLDMEEDLSGPKEKHGGRHPIPPLEIFQQMLRQFGVNRNSHIVCYDENKLAGAARAWWLLRYFGFDRISILDGGLSAWQQAGLELVVDTHSASQSGDVVLTEGHMPVLDYRQIRELLRDDKTIIIDSREAFRHRGESEPIDPVAGCIPGSVNYPWQMVVAEDDRIHDQQFLKQHWQALDTDKQWVFYCGSGVTAAVNVLSIVYAGFDSPALYNNSWSDWCSYSDNPVEVQVAES